MPMIGLIGVIAVLLFILAKGADLLVDEAVSLSIHWGIPKMVVGATIVSLGTTLPEATISVLAAVNGNPDLALGNAIGSIIADTGLILGLAAMIGPLAVDPKTINRQGRLQVMAVVLLAIVSLPFFSEGLTHGTIYQWMGIAFLVLLVGYIYLSMRWAVTSGVDEGVVLEEKKRPLWEQVGKLVTGIALVILSSRVLIPTVETLAINVGIPQGVIAATLVAFGTSLPELVTAITAVRKGHGELAVGNIIGADILNVLFVVGSAAAVTSQGLDVPLAFYKLQIPAMILIVGFFRIVAKNAYQVINRFEGFVLFLLYGIYLFLNFVPMW
ncbi:sodium:calcium antiporter [Clostridia bacterium]|nr:sodium:calcium antiporter [Clostridia bacterium]